MNWHYVSGNEQRGPVDQGEFERLVQSGSITAETLVWHEGLAEWRSYGEVAQPQPPPAAGPATGGVVCSQCGGAFGVEQMIRLGSGFVCATCKPIAMQKLREGVADGNSERIRQEHIKHEASVKSVGILYFLGSVFMILGGAISLANGDGVSLVVGLFFVAIGGLQIWVGIGLRRLRPWARIPTGILSGLGLLGFPLGTLINAYILYLIFSQKGKTVFSEEYQRIIEETPHIKYKTSIVVWVLVGLLVALVGFGLLGFFFSRRV